MIYAGSIASGDRREPRSEPLTEESLCYPRTLYGQTKLRGEQAVRERAKQFGFRYVIFRLATVYGPDYREGSIFGHYTRWITSGALPGRIHWPGKISTIYIDDVVDILMSTVSYPEMEGDTFFVSSPEVMTIGAWTKIMAEAMGKELRQIMLPSWMVRCASALFFQNWFWRLTPNAVAFNAWRLSLVLSDGFYCDASKLNRLYPKSYLTVREGVQLAYHRDETVNVEATA